MTLEEAKRQIVQLVDAEEVEGQLALSQLWATRERSKSIESVPPLATIDPKAKL